MFEIEISLTQSVHFFLTNGLLYLGPETVMPLASIIAAVVGFLLIFWRLLLRPIKKLYRIIVRKDDGKSATKSEVTDAADEIDEEMPNQ